MKKTIWNFLWTGVLLPLIKEHGPEFIDWLYWKIKGQKPGVIEISDELNAKSDGLTPYEQCLKDHAGQCGRCDQNGSFTACP